MYIEFKNDTDYDDYCFEEQLFEEELIFQLNTIEHLENQQVIDETFLAEQKIIKSKLGELIRDENKVFDTSVKFDSEFR